MTRRSFIVKREVPHLLAGGLRGDPVALRRILGARRTGRWGLGLAALALALVAPSAATAGIVAALHLGIGASGFMLRGKSLGLELRPALLLSLWIVAPLWALGSLGRLLLPGSLLPAVAASLLAEWLVWRGVQAGIERDTQRDSCPRSGAVGKAIVEAPAGRAGRADGSG